MPEYRFQFWVRIDDDDFSQAKERFDEVVSQVREIPDVEDVQVRTSMVDADEVFWDAR